MCIQACSLVLACPSYDRRKTSGLTVLVTSYCVIAETLCLVFVTCNITMDHTASVQISAWSGTTCQPVCIVCFMDFLEFAAIVEYV